MKKLEQTFRWYGPDDPVSLSDIRQAGATGIVTALHHVENGKIWTKEEISKRQSMIEAAGLTWSVVESLPVTEEIKQQTGNWKEQIENYKVSLKNLADCGIHIVTYNFMPVLDWIRTNLQYELPDGAIALRFEWNAIAAFDLFVLQRKEAKLEYPKDLRDRAEKWYQNSSELEKNQLIRTIIDNLPGAEIGYTLQDFKTMLSRYEHIGREELKQHLVFFLKEITPVADELGIQLAIHPDDPPFSLFGLPRIVSTAEDLAYILTQVESKSNGLCFCTGSLGAREDNDLPEMISKFGDRIHFLHLRNTKRDDQGNFFEASHLDGDTDMFLVMKELVRIQQEQNRSIPMRPDHGHIMLDDKNKQTNPGYPAVGRLRGLAELRGLEMGIARNLETT